MKILAQDSNSGVALYKPIFKYQDWKKEFLGSFISVSSTDAVASSTKVDSKLLEPQSPKIKVEILDPSDPQLNSDESQLSPPASGWREGTKRILRSVVNVCQRVNQLILKVVAKMFPWNRRAKRRLRGVGEDEDEL